MRLRFLQAAVVSVAIVGWLVYGGPRVKARSCGPYTDRLCPGQSLNANEYIESANGDFKFYYTGSAIVYDVTGSTWTVVYTLYSGPQWGNPDELTYADPWFGSGYGASHISIWEYIGNEDYLLGFWYDTSVTPSGSHELVLDNDGCLKTKDGSGNTLKVWTSC
jgi:hypothetical protein